MPAYTVINQRIGYAFDEARNIKVPVIGAPAPLFGAVLEAEERSTGRPGQENLQAKNCMNCHTLLGNGAYYAPDLTKAWLDPDWVDRGNGRS